MEGRFVEKTADGYELQHAGTRFVQTVVASTGIDAPTVEATELDKACKYCGGATEVFYENQHLYKRCTECEGCFGEEYDQPEGTLAVVTLDPAGLTNRSLEETYHAAWAPGGNPLHAASEGACQVCSGPVDSSIHICDDHASDGVCATCGRLPAIMAHFGCPVCKDVSGAPPYRIVAYHPAVVAFYYERGIALQYEVDDFDSLRRREDLVVDHEQELVAEDPIRVRVTIEYEGDELHVALDEELNVIDLNEGD